ncbi:MAG: ZIP family metal transporter [Silanimonas sp.]
MSPASVTPLLEGAWLHATVFTAALALVAVSASGAWWMRCPRGGSAARLLALLGLAVGALLGDVLLHLLPHAWKDQGVAPTLLLAMAGFGLFAAVDRLRSRRHRSTTLHGRWSRTRMVAVLLVDGLHHLVDGVMLAVAFSASPALGVATWIALLAHELPKEWGELAMLVTAGRSVRQAVRLNVSAAAPLLLGAGAGLAWGDGAHAALGWLGAVVAGGFLYLVLFLLWPAVRRLRWQTPVPLRRPWWAMAAGLFAMGALAFGEQRLGLGHGHVHGLDGVPRESPKSFAPWLQPEG